MPPPPPTRSSDLVLELGVPVEGCTCRRLAVEALERLDGVLRVHIDTHESWALVTFDPGRITCAPIIGCLAEAGYAPRTSHLFDDEPQSPDVGSG